MANLWRFMQTIPMTHCRALTEMKKQPTRQWLETEKPFRVSLRRRLADQGVRTCICSVIARHGAYARRSVFLRLLFWACSAWQSVEAVGFCLPKAPCGGRRGEVHCVMGSALRPRPAKAASWSSEFMPSLMTVRHCGSRV